MSEQLRRIKITDPDNPPAPPGGGRWVQRGDWLEQLAPPTRMGTKPVNKKAEGYTPPVVAVEPEPAEPEQSETREGEQ